MALDTRLPLMATPVDFAAGRRQKEKEEMVLQQSQASFPLLQQQRQQNLDAGAVNIEQSQQDIANTKGKLVFDTATGLKTIPLAQRASALTRVAPQLIDAGWTEQDILSADLSDRGLDEIVAATQGFNTVVGKAIQPKFVGTPNRVTRGKGKEKQSFLVGISQTPNGNFERTEIPIDGEFVSTQGETGAEESQRKVGAAGQTKAISAAVNQGEKAFEQVEGIREKIGIYDEVIDLINNGAETGAIASRLPSVRAASIALDNAQQRLGLNVISNTTFGALSEGELKLALNTGLPKNLDGPDLIEWLTAKRTAQQKLMNYTQEAANALSSGRHTISSYLELQEAKAVNRENPQPDSGGVPEIDGATFLGFE